MRLSTPVCTYLKGHPSWDQHEKDDYVRVAFRQFMRGKAYGYNETLQAWHTFRAGYIAGLTP